MSTVRRAGGKEEAADHAPEGSLNNDQQPKSADPQVSLRITNTQAPVIEFTRRVMAMRPDVISLAQGVVHWAPPPEALDAAAAAVRIPSVNIYGPCEGLPQLRDALIQKLATKNGLHQHKVCITHGANQAFINVVLSLVDPKDGVVLFEPAYFDHLMTITQLGGQERLVSGRCDPVTLHPDIRWLRQVLSGPDPPCMVVVCNPCNPTGVLLDQQEMQDISDACAAAGSWLVVDETYEEFVFGGRKHFCPSGPHVVHIFSFSKAYGMMGWRVGYIAYPDYDGTDKLGYAFLKCQDTICICATQVSQHMAVAAMEKGEAYKRSMLDTLEGNRELVLDALSPLGKPGDGNIAGGEGAIYFWARLPTGCEDDMAAVEWLVKHAGVCAVPGSSCAGPGWLRISFGNLPPERMPKACARLKWGLSQLKQLGGFGEPNSELPE